MSERYKVRDLEATFFITMTIWDWIDLFTRERYITILEDSFQYCIDHKGLIIYAYVIMPSHVHLLAASTTVPLNEIIRDLKKHTSKEFINAIHEPGESRKKWLLREFEFAARRINRGSKFKVWKDGFHPKIMDKNQKLEAAFNYIHYNPVDATYVSHERDWIHGSARAYEDPPESRIKITRWY